jgi:hypothetical protein
MQYECLFGDCDERALQAGGSQFKSRKLHQTANELEKPFQKCGAFRLVVAMLLQ